MRYKTLLSVILLAFLGSTAFGQSFNERRNEKRAYAVKPGMRLDITNKYGKVHIQPWEKDSVVIAVDVSVSSSSLKRVKRMMSSVQFDFTETDSYIVAQTEYGSRSNQLLQEIKDFAAAFIPAEASVNIRYEISAPAYLNLKINNKYGDVFLDDHQGTLELHLSNGDLKCNKLPGESDLVLDFANATIHQLGEGRIYAAYAEVRVDEADDLYIQSRSSKLEIGQVRQLEVDAKHDKYTIGRNEDTQGVLFWTDFHIENLSKSIHLDSRYGSISLDQLNPGFAFVELMSNFTDIHLTLSPETSYHLDVHHSKDQLYLPFDMQKLTTRALDEEGKEYNTYGDIGLKPENAKVEITSYRGYIKIREEL